MATECNNKNHSAAFPEELPEWFIKLFTKDGDQVLDPFMGSGTTLIVAKRMNRNSIGMETVAEYCEAAAEQLGIEIYKNNNKLKLKSTKNEQAKSIGRNEIR
jgi:site-specific DNA-methyltransferase (adenine-specific)/site-specific DNA-methyltransferase (cytosine-N4-specific)